MRIAWAANSPWTTSGYGQQTALFAPRIKALGHEIALIATYGLEGSILNWRGIPVYPRGQNRHGMDVMAAHAEHFQADILITLFDAWTIEPFLLRDTRWVPWFPVDREPIPPAVTDKVKHAWRSIVYSKFGEREARAAGLTPSYVPHGVDTAAYSPGSKADARKALDWPKDAFIVGMVAANKDYPSRKAFPQSIAAFAELRRKHSDALLYIHSRSNRDDTEGVNLLDLARFYGVEDAVIFSAEYQHVVGFPTAYMIDVYRGMDVLLAASMGEGFGVPIIEAQAAGTPVIVGDWTATAELCFGGWQVAREDAEPWWTQEGALQFLPRIGPLTEALKLAYAALGHKDIALRKARAAREGALAYDADTVTRDYWAPVLAEMEAQLQAAPASFAEALRV